MPERAYSSFKMKENTNWAQVRTQSASPSVWRHSEVYDVICTDLVGTKYILLAYILLYHQLLLCFPLLLHRVLLFVLDLCDVANHPARDTSLRGWIFYSKNSFYHSIDLH